MPGTFLLNRFADEIEATVAPAFAVVADSENLVPVMTGITERAEASLARLLPETERQQQDCGPGCGSCCVVNVSVLFPEGVVIADRVSRQWSREERNALLVRLDDLYQATRWLDDDERIILRRPCAFLDGGQKCLIHPFRPLLCRAISSVDRESCREAVAGVCFGENRPIQMNLWQKDLKRMCLAIIIIHRIF